MNDTPSSSSQALPDSVPPPVKTGGTRRRLSGLGSSRKMPYIVSAVLALLLAGQWWNSHSEIRRLRADVAGRLQSGESMNTETRILVKSAQESARELQAKVTVLESRQAEAQSQQLALEQLYQELAKSRDEWALAEIEQVLSTASQQLQLAGNVQGALIALQNADTRLSHSDSAQFIAIRRSIARDLDRLKSLPTVDVTGIALRLDSLIAQIDGMPLLSGEKPVSQAVPPKTSRRAGRNEQAAAKPSAKTAAVGDWLDTVEEKWNSWTSEMWTDVRQLIRIRSVETPEALLLSPSQAYFVRENLKLRLMNARLALLARNESAFRSDLIAAQDGITRYFDTRARQTQTALALLKQVQGSNLAIQMPTLSDTLSAVRNYKAKP